MAKGTESKNTVFAKLQEIFPDAFWEDQGKILRVPLNENGSRVEIKVTLTAAKTNLGGEDIPSAFTSENVVPATNTSTVTSEVKKPEVLKPTQEEKDNIARLMASLDL